MTEAERAADATAGSARHCRPPCKGSERPAEPGGILWGVGCRGPGGALQEKINRLSL